MDALYISAAGMIAQNQSLGLIAGNIANSQSAGYLAQQGTFTAFPTGSLEDTGSGKVLGQTSNGVAFSSSIATGGGGVSSTTNPNDLAIVGQGYFVVRTPQGLAYTRDGQFSVDGKGNLVTAEGDFVLNQAGKPIQLQSGQSFSVSPTGVITQGNATIGTLALTNLSATGLAALGNNLYTSPTRTPFTGQVIQSSLNTSNVNVENSMVDMIDAQSWYQSLTQVVNEESKRLATAATLGELT